MILNYDIKLPTLNEYINAERRNRFVAAKIKKDATNTVKLLTMAQTRQKLHGMYDLELIWTAVNKRTDADNIYFGVKFILDGIVESGVLVSDSRKHVRNISHKIVMGDKRNVCVNFRLAKKEG